MIANSRNSNFHFHFPKGFWYKSVIDSFTKYVKRNPLPWDTVENFMAAQIQSVSFPGLTMPTVSQTRRLGKQQEYKGSTNVADLFDRNLTITFKAVDGYVNYWISLENAMRYYDFENKAQYMEDMQMRFLDQDGSIMYTIKYNKVILTGISELSMSYSDNNPNFKTFSMTFSFYDMKMVIEHD
jgi:hypothetical protein